MHAAALQTFGMRANLMLAAGHRVYPCAIHRGREDHELVLRFASDTVQEPLAWIPFPCNTVPPWSYQVHGGWSAL